MSSAPIAADGSALRVVRRSQHQEVPAAEVSKDEAQGAMTNVFPEQDPGPEQSTSLVGATGCVA